MRDHKMDASKTVYLKPKQRFSVWNTTPGRATYGKMHKVVGLGRDKQGEVWWYAFDDDSSSFYLCSAYRVVA